MKSIVLTISLTLLSFAAGFGLAGNLASRDMTLYVSVPGEYLVSAPGGNSVYAAAIIGSQRDFVRCEYLKDRRMYDSIITHDVIMERSSLAPRCYAAFMHERWF